MYIQPPFKPFQTAEYGRVVVVHEFSNVVGGEIEIVSAVVVYDAAADGQGKVTAVGEDILFIYLSHPAHDSA